VHVNAMYGSSLSVGECLRSVRYMPRSGRFENGSIRYGKLGYPAIMILLLGKYGSSGLGNVRYHMRWESLTTSAGWDGL